MTELLAAPWALFDFLIWKVLPFLVVLTVVVFIHELGHFLAGRWNKVKIEAFSVGFGPELFGFWDRHQTRWKFCAIPLGGYVKFFGDADGSSRPDRDALASMDMDERSQAFEHKALWQRASIVAAGPIANFVLAIFIYTALFISYGDVRVLPVVGNVLENSAAEEAGFAKGDRILTLNGSPVERFLDIQRITSVSSDEKLDFTVDRKGEEVALQVVPRMTEREDGFGNKYRVGLIGISPDNSKENFVYDDVGPIDAFVKALDRTWMTIYGTYNFIKELIVGKQSASELRGPIGIGQLTSQVATLSLFQLIPLAALLSISIGILNLLPVPMLDGGHLLFYLIEAIRGKALDEKTQDIAFRIGLTCVLGLMLFATSNDLIRIMGLSS